MGKHSNPVKRDCPGCGGSGENAYGATCGVCRGDGKIEASS